MPGQTSIRETIREEDVFAAVFPAHMPVAGDPEFFASKPPHLVLDYAYKWTQDVLANHPLSTTLRNEIGELNGRLQKEILALKDSGSIDQGRYLQICHDSNMAHTNWKREGECTHFLKQLYAIESHNLFARYLPGYLTSRALQPSRHGTAGAFAAFIVRRVRSETRAYRLWTDAYKAGRAVGRLDELPSQPCRRWNRMLRKLAAVSEDMEHPLPMPFEVIMRTLEQAALRKTSYFRNAGAPVGIFQGVPELALAVNVEAAVAQLAADMWSVQMRTSQSDAELDGESQRLKKTIEDLLAYHTRKVLYSSAGQLRAYWKWDGVPRGEPTTASHRYTSHLQYGVPYARVVDGRLEEEPHKPIVSPIDVFLVDIAVYEGNFIFDIQPVEENPPPYAGILEPPPYDDAELPSYDEVAANGIPDAGASGESLPEQQIDDGTENADQDTDTAEGPDDSKHDADSETSDSDAESRAESCGLEAAGASYKGKGKGKGKNVKWPARTFARV